MNREERIQRLRDFGYPIIHLFGNWYLGRIWSKNYNFAISLLHTPSYNTTY